ncbi:MAG TPA: UDP-N-acetylglucosamine 4,6-dehydratase (inverting) [Bryobacteraceae bacterium]|nr:UDP-N-acetylglucosamine 4,6-dehydratase (inverting) [Bryobacteraceae bacterium]
MNWHDLSVLITGATGSFGKRCVRTLLDHYGPKRVIVFSRDELKQHEMMTSGFQCDSLRYYIGDVRDAGRLRRAMVGVDVVIHAAALKQVPACEYNPIEAVQTNVNGAKNVIEAALDCGVKRVLALSTDKAVSPINLYGATKLVAEKLFVQANSYSGAGAVRFSCVRYGNVVGSRGSVIPLFLQQKKTGCISVTDPRMTRFWITLDQGVRFVLNCIEQMHGGEVFIPKIPSTSVMDLIRVIGPDCKLHEIGIRPGEKLHECLMSEDESRAGLDLGDFFVIQPMHKWWVAQNWSDGRPIPEGFAYSSNSNDRWLTAEQLQEYTQPEMWATV